mgnify:CR=1 FL=1
MDKVKRREFLKGVPLFGAGVSLGLTALAEADDAPKARKLSGENVEPSAYCNTGTIETECNTGAGGTCNAGTTLISCNVGY